MNYTYDEWKNDAPDPGSVECDDRCGLCGADDDEPCTSDCPNNPKAEVPAVYVEAD